MKESNGTWTWVVAGIALAAAVAVTVFGCRAPDVDAAPGGVLLRGETSDMPSIEPSFEKMFAELSRETPLVMQRALALLHERQDLEGCARVAVDGGRMPG